MVQASSAAPEVSEPVSRARIEGLRRACSCSRTRSSAGEQESPSLTADSDLTFEDRHSAWLAGVDYGMAQRVELEVENLVQAALQRRTLEALGMAKREARHGPAFSQLVRESGER